MKIWVVGSEGMLGSALLQCCQRNALDAVGTSRHDADITDLSRLIETSGRLHPTHIVNCAAFTDVDGAEKNPELAHAVNVLGAKNVAEVAKSCDARLVHISTDYVFNGKQSQPYTEQDPCEPINAYGRSKREAEILVAQTHPNACILRTSWLFGAKGKNFISSVLKWLQQSEVLQVVSDQCGKPTYCHDFSQAVLALLDAEGIVHFANEGVRSRFQIAQDVMHAAKARGHLFKCQSILPVSSVQFPTPAARPAYSVLDTFKYTSLTNHRPRSWDEVMNEYLDHAL